ncbi:MAG: type II toxin-antitoxin system RelE/ParE family toxin [Candidatus Limnocylindrales bacterium]
MTAYEVRLSRSALRRFKKLGDADRDRIGRALQRLARDVARPERFSGKSVKPIRGTDDTFYRLRIGDYRVMCDVIEADHVILVLGIVDRADLERWLRGR